jgi:hypothetical protein
MFVADFLFRKAQSFLGNSGRDFMIQCFEKLIRIIIILTIIGLPGQVQAIRFVDKTYDHNMLENGCFGKNEFIRLGFYKDPGSIGFQANYHSENDLIELLVMLYACDFYEIENKGNKNSPEEDGLLYFISMNNRKDDGSLATILRTLTLSMESAIMMPDNMKVFSTIKSTIESVNFKKIIEKYGEKNTFINCVDMSNLEYHSLMDFEGRLLLSREEEIEKLYLQ